MFKKKRVLSLFAVSALALTACGTNDEVTDTETPAPAVEEQEDTSADEATTNETTEAEVETPAADDYANLTLQPEEAFDIYQEKYPDATITQIQLDKDMEKYVYKVEGFEGMTEYELKIDPMDGTILEEDMDTDDDMDELAIHRDDVTKVMVLVEQALADAGDDAKLEEWSLDMDDGIVKLEIELDKKGMDDEERTYNVETGELMEIDN